MMVTLVCAVVGEKGSAFSIDIATNKSVDHLKDAIKVEKLHDRKDVDADKLRLFLATKDGKWLPSSFEDVEKLRQGEKPCLIKTLTSINLELNEINPIAKCLENMETPQLNQLHVLAMLPDIIVQVGEEKHPSAVVDELTHYQQRGKIIQRNCKDYCQQILAKIDDLYALPQDYPLPFICVEGSSGMGKSQLAFALGGSRPWFYWITNGILSQRLYQNFSSISDAFFHVTYLDDPTNKSETDILNPMSGVYKCESLWTYGFILALLEYCSEEHNQHGHMIRFQEKMSLSVVKCKLQTVIGLREQMKADGMALPFIMLDEMTPNMHIDGGEKNLSAFQRNVFRVCGLVVVVMGTDANISNLVDNSGKSCQEPCAWTTIISRFPPYQPIPFADGNTQIAWDCLEAQYPVLQRIVANSRGRFSRYFIDKAVQYAVENSGCGVKLCDLLDVAFGHVSQQMQVGKGFMAKQEGMDAHLKAISYINVGTDGTAPPSLKKEKAGSDVETHCMHLHFANLVDHQATEVIAARGSLLSNDVEWEPCCRFPTMEDDLLLYLAVLGGKTCSGYYDRLKRIDHSTLHIFSMYLKGREFATEEATNTESNDFYETFENMVAHMIFCASRRNGVQGISFDDFFAGLLSECQDQIQPVTMTIGSTKKTIVASDLLDKYAAQAGLSCTNIPFLAPPNARWPQWILDTHGDGCNFGHIVRTWRDEGCDLYVCNMEDMCKPPLFLCECKYWDKSMDIGVMVTIICELYTVWKENWTLVLVFCSNLASFQTKWHHENVGCVKVDCRSCRVDWVFQPVEEDRNQLVIVMEMGSLTATTHKAPSA